MGPVDILLLLAVALIAGLAIRSIIKRKKGGGCSCGCGNCSGSENCGACPKKE